jgi:hypothetical protein
MFMIARNLSKLSINAYTYIGHDLIIIRYNKCNCFQRVVLWRRDIPTFELVFARSFLIIFYCSSSQLVSEDRNVQVPITIINEHVDIFIINSLIFLFI